MIKSQYLLRKLLLRQVSGNSFMSLLLSSVNLNEGEGHPATSINETHLEGPAEGRASSTASSYEATTEKNRDENYK